MCVSMNGKRRHKSQTMFLNIKHHKRKSCHIMLGLLIATMCYECHMWHICNTRMKRNASEYGSQQIVSVRDIRDVRGGCF